MHLESASHLIQTVILNSALSPEYNEDSRDTVASGVDIRVKGCTRPAAPHYNHVISALL